MSIIDTHIHLVSGDREKFPLHPDGAYQPQKSYPIEDYIPVMEDAGISGAVLVHCEPYLDDHRYTLHCLAQEPKRLKGTCLFAPHDSEGPAKMAALIEKAGPGTIVAFRIHAYRDDGIPDFESPELKALWGRAVELGLCVQLHFAPRYAGAFAKIYRQFSDCTVILDHLGRPGQGNAVVYEDVAALAEFENCYLKFSAISSASSEPWPHRDVKPIVSRMASRFGAERILYGGGYSSGTTAPEYRKAPELVEILLGHLTAEDKERILGLNAIRLFGFEV
ncbi:MAG: amidohydrolase family protein [Planctomycetota bacterium]|nr:amidohydrolase family protein [Planctomycetota bacterium]MDP7250756.1 amidohydrolase family protein [Planctomycetota bacterium]